MSSHHTAATEHDSGAGDSVASTPRSIHHPPHEDPTVTRVRLMCSFGGKILPRPHDNQLRYVGGDTRIVAVHRHATFSYLLTKLSKLSGTTNISIKYQLPNEDLDALITVTTDEDVENMMEEYDRLVLTHKSARLRLFLFSADGGDSRASSISSLLDGSAKREHWFLDALNGGRGPGLERGQSEVSSIVSEVPDYLFGLENSDDAPRDIIKFNGNKQKSNMHENIPGSDPGSPAPVVSSPFCSVSSSLAPPSVPALPDLPPVKTKPFNPGPVNEPGKEAFGPVGGVNELGGEHVPIAPVQGGYSNNPTVQYSGQPVQPVPVYYMHGNVPVQPVQMGGGYVQSYPIPTGQVPPGYLHPASSLGQMYGGAGPRPVAIDLVSGRVIAEVANQPMVYGVRNTGMVAAYPGMVVPGQEEIQGPGGETKIRVSHGP